MGLHGKNRRPGGQSTARWTDRAGSVAHLAEEEDRAAGDERPREGGRGRAAAEGPAGGHLVHAARALEPRARGVVRLREREGRAAHASVFAWKAKFARAMVIFAGSEKTNVMPLKTDSLLARGRIAPRMFRAVSGISPAPVTSMRFVWPVQLNVATPPSGSTPSTQFAGSAHEPPSVALAHVPSVAPCPARAASDHAPSAATRHARSPTVNGRDALLCVRAPLRAEPGRAGARPSRFQRRNFPNGKFHRRERSFSTKIYRSVNIEFRTPRAEGGAGTAAWGGTASSARWRRRASASTRQGGRACRIRR